MCEFGYDIFVEGFGGGCVVVVVVFLGGWLYFVLFVVDVYYDGVVDFDDFVDCVVYLVFVVVVVVV